MTQKIYYEGQYHEIPEEGKLPSRGVAGAWVERAAFKLRYEADKRLGCEIGTRGDQSLLTEREYRLSKQMQRAAYKLAESLKRHPLEMLAEEVSDPVEEVLDDYHGEVYNLSEVDKLRMAFRLLDDVIGEDVTDDFRRVCAGERVRLDSPRRKGPIHVCAWCEGEGSFCSDASWRRVDCARCDDGFIYAEDEARVEADDEVPSKAGCRALSLGQTWTLEQEIEAQGYDSVEDYLEYEGEESLANVRTNLEEAKKFPPKEAA